MSHNDKGEFKAGPLYDLARDVSERTDRISDHPKHAKRLQLIAESFYQKLHGNVRPIGSLAVE
ncbi:MAG: hypothetical protein QGG09_02415 [Pirellulaceae bacterium]|nr:hypothetical protein [Pirellulaceae bacterium]HJN12403.1 hypothetical protein [Pirellulaceae bacterium]